MNKLKFVATRLGKDWKECDVAERHIPKDNLILEDVLLIDAEDDAIYNLLKDMFYPVIMQKLDEKTEHPGYQDSDKKNRIKLLEKLDMQHEKHMITKRFLWKEIDIGTEQMKCSYDSYYDGIILKHFNQIIECIKVIKPEKLKKQFQDDLLLLAWEVIWHVDKILYFDSDLWREFLHSLIELIYDIQNMHDYTMSIMNKNLWELMSIFRDNRVGLIGTKIWMLFLIISFIDYDEELHQDLIKLDLKNTEEFLCIISKYQKKIDKELINEQREIQENMLLLYNLMVVPKGQAVFAKKTDEIINILEQIPALRAKYIDKDATGCFATMASGGRKYIAISDTYHDNAYEREINKILGEGYELVRFGPSTRYYYNKQSFITYELYANNQGKCMGIKNIEHVNRMFSCCEKKLLSELFKRNHKERFTMYIKMKPCKMCERALKHYDKMITEGSRVCYPSGSKERKLNISINKYDRIARDILSKCPS